MIRHGQPEKIPIPPGESREIGALVITNDGHETAWLVVSIAGSVEIRKRGKRPLVERVRDRKA